MESEEAKEALSGASIIPLQREVDEESKLIMEAVEPVPQEPASVEPATLKARLPDLNHPEPASLESASLENVSPDPEEPASLGPVPHETDSPGSEQYEVNFWAPRDWYLLLDGWDDASRKPASVEPVSPKEADSPDPNQPESASLDTSDDHSKVEKTSNYQYNYQQPWFSYPNPNLQISAPVMSRVLEALIKHGITVVEYGSQVLHRCGYSAALDLAEWAVPDEQLPLASQCVTDLGFPIYDPRFAFEDDNLWKTQCRAHTIRALRQKSVHLFPLSFIDLTLEETVEAPSTFDKSLSLLTPKPPRYLLSLFRHLLRLPVGDPSRRRVERDICAIMDKLVLHSLPAHTPRWVFAAESEESYQSRVERGVREMKEWDWGEVDERFLEIAERALRDPCYTRTLTDVPAVTNPTSMPWW